MILPPSEPNPPEAPDRVVARISEFFEKAPVALSLADARREDQPLIVANTAFLKLTGYSSAEVIGRNCRFLQDDLPNSQARSEVHEILEHTGQGQTVFRNRRKDGTEFDNLLFLQALTDREGVPVYFLGSQFELHDRVSSGAIRSHLSHIDAAVHDAIEAQSILRAEQRRMFHNAALAVANAWLAMR